MIFQDPTSCLNPVYTIGEQIAETLRVKLGMGGREARERAAELLDHVGIPAATPRLGSYPHELSGGMRQRVMIAIAIACRPRLLLADEPTTALDVTIQDQILALLAELQHEFGMAMVLVSHDLGVVAQNCDSVAVMYAGYVVEDAPGGDALPHAAPPVHGRAAEGAADDPPRRRRAGGSPRSAARRPTWRSCPAGCPFRPRCPSAREACADGDDGAARASATPHLTACPFARGDCVTAPARGVAPRQALRAAALRPSRLGRRPRRR